MPTIDPNEVPQLHDKRPKIAGLLPKNTQGMVICSIALLMVLVILFSGHNAPKQKAPVPTPGPIITDPSAPRIQDYRSRIEEQMRKLAAEEAELARTKQGMDMRPNEPALPNSRMPSYPPSYGPPVPIASAELEGNWIEGDRRKRAYRSLFASNVVLTHRHDAVTSAVTNAAQSTPVIGKEAGASTSGEAPSQTQYRLFEGTILETVLTNRLDSTFSGPVNCMVTTNAYSHDGEKLLIPQGSRVLGEVRKLESFGEQRLACSFHRLIMPDGFSVDLDQFKGLDQIGETGFRDQVNHHYLQVFGVSIALGALAGLSQSNTRCGLNESAMDTYRQGVASSVSQAAMHVLDRYLNVMPTFTIREGYRIKIYLSQDLMLPSVTAHPVRNDL